MKKFRIAVSIPFIFVGSALALTGMGICAVTAFVLFPEDFTFE